MHVDGTTDARRDRGAVLPLVALVLGGLILSAALAIDIGHQQLLRRDLQKTADAMALDMARALDGSAPSAYNGGTKTTAFQTAFTLTRTRNSFAPTSRQIATAEAGCLVGTALDTFSSIDSDCRVLNADLTLVSVAQAVRVTTKDTVDYFFYPGSGTSTRTGIASHDGTVNYQVGSFLVGTSPNANQINLLNRVLGGILGGPLTLDAVGYNGLASGTVTARQIAAAYGLGSPDQLFTGSVNARRFFNAAADAVQTNGGSSAQAATLRGIATATNTNTQFNFSSVSSPGGSLGAGSGNGSAFDTSMDLLDIVEGSAFVINGSNTLSVPGISMTAPFGLTSVDLTLKVIEAPRNHPFAHVGDILTTSQVELGITAHVSADVTATLSAAVSGLPGIGGVANATLAGTVNVSPKVAGATASPTSIRCADITTNPGATISLSANPITATASESLTLSASLLSVLGLPLGNADLLTTNISGASVSTTSSADSADFAYTSEFMPPVGPAGPKRLGSGSLNLGSALTATSANSTVVGVTVPLANSLTAVNNVLTASIVPGLTNLLPLITRTLGLQVGGGDVGARDIGIGGICTAVKLAG